MTSTTALLVGRETGQSQPVFETHAARLRERGTVDRVEVLTYEHDPVSELREDLRELTGEVYALPLCPAHTNETTESLPAALSAVDGDVAYCEPVGRHPAVTGALLDRARARQRPVSASVILVALGNSSGSHYRETVQYHADRIEQQSDYETVHTCYLVENPAVECVRYNVSTESAVAVPFFVTPGPATDQQIPDRLELDRGGVAYATPLGAHEQVTEALVSMLETRQAVDAADTYEDELVAIRRPMATDGQGG